MSKYIIIFLFIIATVACGQVDETNQEETNTQMNTEKTNKEESNTEKTNKEETNKEETNKEEQLSDESLEEMIEKSGLQIGEVIPSLTLKTLAGDIFSNETIKGKKVMINFWASWCEPCRLEMPDIVRIHEGFKDDLVIVTINVRENEADIKEFVEEFGMDFPVLLDKTGEMSEQFQLIAMPTTYFINTDATLSTKHVGIRNYQQFVDAYQNLY